MNSNFLGMLQSTLLLPFLHKDTPKSGSLPIGDGAFLPPEETLMQLFQKQRVALETYIRNRER